MVHSWPTPEFEPNQIRLIVYQDCERRGRNVMFDSSTKRKSEELPVSKLCSDAHVKVLGKCCQLKLGGGSSNSLDSSISSSSSSSSDSKEHCPKYQSSRCSSDANMLGEMMFGSVAMSYTGSTLKIHQIRSPPQLMMSKVFTVRTGSSAYGSLNTLQDSLEFISQDNTLKPDHNNSMNNLLGNIGLTQLCSPRRAFSEQGPLRLIRSASFFGVHSNPMDMPGRGLNEDREGGIARSASLSSLLITPFPSPNSSLASSCASSYQRRWLRSQTTSLENGVFPRWSVEESFNMSTDSCGSNPGITRKKKIAIGIIFSLSKDEEQISKFHDFFFSHFPLFESHMNKLKSAIEQAMKMSRRSADASQRTLAYNRIVDALGEFRTTICNLYTMPRIAEPVWLTMMSGIPEKNQLCQRFMKEFASLMEQSSKNQFLPALLTAVLTNHLAWVPTVMPNGHPPIKIFLEKHSSQSVDMLAKTHPYNPLWAQLGDLYGAIGSPVRLARTVVIGKKQELVQRLLYFLTYFIRCSELQETHLLENGDDEAIVMPGTLITTALEKGEIEDSDYVFVTILRTKQGLLSEDVEREHTSGTCKSGVQLHHNSQEMAMNTHDPRHKMAISKILLDTSPGKNGSPGTFKPPLDSQGDTSCLKQCIEANVCVDNKVEKIVPLRSASLAKQLMIESMMEPNAGTKQCDEQIEPVSTSVKVLRSTSIAVEKKPPDKLLSPTFICNMKQLQTKVTFQIGDSMSPDSDTETRSKTVEEQISQHHNIIGVEQNHSKEQCPESKQTTQDQSTACGPTKILTRVPSELRKLDRQFSEGSISLFDDYFTEDEPIDCRTIDDILPEQTSNLQLELSKRWCPKDTKQQNELKHSCSYVSHLNTNLCEKRSAEQDKGENISLHVPSGDNTDSDKKVPSVAEWDIPRNESSDSALGDSESEDASQDITRHNSGYYYRDEQEEWMEETEIPFPGSKLVEVNAVKPSIANFGRSLLGGYCPTYVPDFVLHGTGSDEKLRQCLMTDLSHTVQHPVLDEPIAEAVCIIADVDKWTVQVASSQRRPSDVSKLGKEVLVSSLVSNLLHSTLQLYKHNLSPNFCVMHLEDRLQELYFKSKMLSEYLKGQMRVHVKELSRVLSIESSDLPLLAAVASTHSPYVAQILL